MNHKIKDFLVGFFYALIIWVVFLFIVTVIVMAID